MTALVDAKEILRMRLSSQRIEPPSGIAPTVAEVARQLLAVQAQDFGQAVWALGLRSPGSTRADVTAALESGAVIRSAPIRGTLHFVAPEDLRWMLSLTAPRMIALSAARHRELELDQLTFDRARDLTTEALAGGRALSRDEYMELLEGAGISTTGQRGYHVIWYLGQTGILCWGPPRGTQQALVLLDEWAPAPPGLGRDEALREFVLRYFTGHGPATLKDFAWWSKLTVADAKVGLDLARGDLTELNHDGASYWIATEEADRAATSRSRPTVHALPGFDEYLIGYQDRSLALAPKYATRVVAGKNGIFFAVIVSRGRIVGTWRRTSKAAGITVTPEPFGTLTKAETAAFARAAKAYTKFFT